LELIERFERNRDAYCSSEYNEAQVRAERRRGPHRRGGTEASVVFARDVDPFSSCFPTEIPNLHGVLTVYKKQGLPPSFVHAVRVEGAGC